MNSSPAVTTVHWLTAGQATPVSGSFTVSTTACGVPGEVGSNVISCPFAPMVVHWLADGHTTSDR